MAENTRRDDLCVVQAHGLTVPDPYQWLEGDDAEVRAFVDAQNAASRPVLDALPGRARFGDLLETLLSAPTRGVPFVRGGAVFAWHNDGANQPHLVRADDADGLEQGETVLDPNELSDDGTLAVVAANVNDAGTLLAYAVSDGGSDWRTMQVRDLETLRDLPVEIPWCKWSQPMWLPGGRAFTYWAYPEPTGNALTDEMPRGALFAHDLDSGETRELWAPDDDKVMAYHFRDDDWFVLCAERGMDDQTKIFARRHEDDEFRLVVDGAHSWLPVTVRGDELVCITLEDSPRGRVVAVSLETGARRELVAEHASGVLERFEPTANGYVAVTMTDAQARARLFDLDGTPGDELPLGEGVSVSGLDTRDDADVFHLATTRFTDRGDRFVGAASGGTLAEWRELERPTGTVAVPSDVRRIRVPSTDGVEVPAFVITPSETADGPQPTLMWGYGGFNISEVPEYRPIFAAWVAAGGTLVIPNLRGGGEFGEAWHDAGTKERKQQVFDDLYAVAERIVADGITTTSQLALHGRSNGGLLAGAALTQRPDLWAAVLPAVGVLDMLRYHRFTIGWAWTRDYGDPDEPGVAEYLLRYSPLHNVRAVEYPPTLITTADRDDRVVPAHSYKFAAELQHTGLGGPFLLAVDTRSGHGAGKPKAAQVEEFADQLAFAAAHTGLEPRV